MLIEKNIVIDGKHGKPIVLDFGYKISETKKPVIVFAHGFKGFKDWGHFNELMEHFIAGMSNYMKPFLAMTTPTINSYTRLVKGFWAPTAATWGVENRTCALRAITGSNKAQRVEYRVGAADANPYLAAAAVIAAGDGHSCALSNEAVLRCWGDSDNWLGF